MSEIENRKIVADAMAELAKGNGAPFAAAMADDFAWRPMGSGAWAKPYVGKQVALDQLFRPLWAQFAERYTNTAANIFADGDHVIVEARGGATTKTGKSYDQRYCFVIRMEGGKMRELREYLDTEHASAVLDASVL
jgi:uncharacterized protein